MNNLPLKYGQGSDGMPLHCLMYAGNTILEVLVDIAKATLEEGPIPDSLKGM